MRKAVCGIALLALLALGLPLVVADEASAQMREFAGKVDKIGKRKMLVDNRMGDKVSFVKTEETVVEGEKTDWDDVKRDDWVSVSWKMMDKPRIAYKVVVMPPKDEDE